uniref:Calmodulin n=2 Tax=Pseudictyota dubia TaxID=2749911 RepID=A0A7R9WCK7_9STRA|mmetsp:Transcript_42212/g.78163  ORF Transcript_42212/g.78163 Transcript_42212/m.78163 type:complete len:249 (+) Transcript_42212:119-865(+)
MRVVAFLLVLVSVSGFSVPQLNNFCTLNVHPRPPSTSHRKSCHIALFSAAGNSGDVEEENNDGFITKEMFMRDMLADPQVKRKKRNGRYRTMDNRDSLPFVVQVQTPDPYTSNDEIKNEARKNTKKAARKNGGGGEVRKNLVGMNAPGTKDGIASSVYSRKADGSLHRVLGEFKLDKNTNCGDLIEVGDREFEVQKARCQYKYAGGKRFVMVRKILEVKEVTRIAEENFLKRQFQKSKSEDDSFPPLE